MAPIDPRKIDEAYVKSLADPLIRYTSEPPHDPLTVLAIATQAALFEALEMITLGEIGLRQVDERARNGIPGSESFPWQCHGQIYAGRKVVRRVAEVLELLRPGELATPGERVRSARGPKYMSRTDLAYAASVHRAHVSRVERGERNLTPEMAARFAEALDVTPEYLLTGKDLEPNPGDAA